MNQDNKFDIRIQERLVKKGTISKKELDEHLKALPDDQDGFELVSIQNPLDENETDDLDDGVDE